MQNLLSQFTKNFIKRLKKALKLGTDTELAIFLGVKQNTISSWKSRNTIDVFLIIAKCEHISFDYLIFGSEPIYRYEKDKQTQAIPLKSVGNNPEIDLLKSQLHEKNIQIEILKEQLSDTKRYLENYIQLLNTQK